MSCRFVSVLLAFAIISIFQGYFGSSIVVSADDGDGCDAGSSIYGSAMVIVTSVFITLYLKNTMTAGTAAACE